MALNDCCVLPVARPAMFRSAGSNSGPGGLKSSRRAAKSRMAVLARLVSRVGWISFTFFRTKRRHAGSAQRNRVLTCAVSASLKLCTQQSVHTFKQPETLSCWHPGHLQAQVRMGMRMLSSLAGPEAIFSSSDDSGLLRHLQKQVQINKHVCLAWTSRTEQHMQSFKQTEMLSCRHCVQTKSCMHMHTSVLSRPAQSETILTNPDGTISLIAKRVRIDQEMCLAPASCTSLHAFAQMML